MFISVSRRLTSRSSTILLGGCYRRCLATAAGSTDHKAFSATLLLPKTTLPLKHKDAVAAELVYRSRTTDELYRKQWANNTGPLFVLHDGPPYANGHLHMGHALNKILKDIITRYNVIRGRKVHYLPGWDCHGLPIEQKALKAIGKSHTAMSPSAVRETARTTAAEAIEMQKEEFRSLAVMADWDNPEGVYITMNAGFEHRQMLLFQKMVEQGHITYRLRPTYYSPSSRTALAESELKYEDGHKSRSVYVGFAVDAADMSSGLRKAYEEAVEKAGEVPLRLAVWTTTAWTLPANAGVNVGEKMEYSIVKTTDNQLLVVAEARREALSEKLGPLETLAQLSGADLSGTRYTHPFHPPSDSTPRPVVFPSWHVTDQSGTGLVHSAPAHGHEDYIAFSKAGLLPKELRCPVDDDGCFTSEVVNWAGSEDARDLVSKSVLGDGVGAMVDLLRRQKALLAEETIEHRYPHDWKTKEPIIVRATPQWFADVEAVKPRALTSLEKVNFYPPQSRNRLEAFVTSRSEWCISRQRSWGVPIPALYDEAGRPVVDKATVSHIIKVLGEKGTDYWWTGPVEEFVPEHLQGQALHKGTDTLDVWFDSGSSWTMLDEVRSEEPLAEVYLEGSDQHRGWFQSSLLTKLSTSHTDTQAPYGNIISHGMVMDEDGQKMSKSAGNGLSPVDVTKGTKEKPGQGADTLRVWAASVDYTRDVSIGPNAIKHASESLRKIRSAMRFLLANTSGEKARALSEVELGPLELYILHELSQLEAQAIASYDVFAFNKVLNSITTFLSSTLSSFYFDAVKETLYCEAAENPKRLAIVAVLQQASNVIRKIIAPIAPHLAEELHEHAGGKDSVFLDTWERSEDRQDMALGEDMRGILDLRSAVNQLGEDLRAKGHIKNVDETMLVIFAEGEALRVLERFNDDLASIFGISTVKLGDDSTVALADSEVALATLGKVRITLSKSAKSKCARCWKHRAEGEELCKRCTVVTRP